MFSNKACSDGTHREKSLPLEAQLCLHREREAFSSSPHSHPVEVAGMEAGCAQTRGLLEALGTELHGSAACWECTTRPSLCSHSKPAAAVTPGRRADCCMRYISWD